MSGWREKGWMSGWRDEGRDTRDARNTHGSDQLDGAQLQLTDVLHEERSDAHRGNLEERRGGAVRGEEREGPSEGRRGRGLQSPGHLCGHV